MSVGFLRNKKIIGGEARRVAEAVARAKCAERIAGFAAELRRAVRRAERVLAAEEGSVVVLKPVRSPLGIAVPVSSLYPGDGFALSDRVGRFVYLRPRKDSPLMLPAWSVADCQLTRAGCRAVDRCRLPGKHRTVGEIRRDLAGAIAERSATVGRLLGKIPRDATVEDVLGIFGAEYEATVEGALGL